MQPQAPVLSFPPCRHPPALSRGHRVRLPGDRGRRHAGATTRHDRAQGTRRGGLRDRLHARRQGRHHRQLRQDAQGVGRGQRQGDQELRRAAGTPEPRPRRGRQPRRPRASPPAAPTTPPASGTSRAASRSASSSMPTPSTPSPSAPTARRWPAPARTAAAALDHRRRQATPGAEGPRGCRHRRRLQRQRPAAGQQRRRQDGAFLGPGQRHAARRLTRAARAGAMPSP